MGARIVLASQHANGSGELRGVKGGTTRRVDPTKTQRKTGCIPVYHHSRANFRLAANRKICYSK